jgi:hypothetical protein
MSRTKHSVGDGKFQAVNRNGQVSIYNARSPRIDSLGNSLPLATIPLDMPPTDSAGRLTAINWLRDHGEITPVQHFLFSESRRIIGLIATGCRSLIH